MHHHMHEGDKLDGQPPQPGIGIASLPFGWDTGRAAKVIFMLITSSVLFSSFYFVVSYEYIKWCWRTRNGTR